MPSVLEALDTVQEEQYQHSPEAVEAMPAVSPAPRRQFWHLIVTNVTSLVSNARQLSQQSRAMIVDSCQPEMQPIDRLARDFPFLYIQASCV